MEINVDVDLGLDNDVDDAPLGDGRVDVHGVANTESVMPNVMKDGHARVPSVVLKTKIIRYDNIDQYFLAHISMQVIRVV